jgi:hypothetical protein
MRPVIVDQNKTELRTNPDCADTKTLGDIRRNPGEMHP